MNVGQWGSTLYVSTGFNMSAYTTLQLLFTKPDLSTMTVTAVLGTTTQTINGVTLTANEYVSYTFATGDLDQVGNWTVQVLYTDAVQHLPSNQVSFPVGA